MQAYLGHEDMWNCIQGSDRDQKKTVKVKSKIILCVNTINCSHIQSAITTKDV